MDGMRASPEAEPEKVKQHFEELKKAEPKKRSKMAKTLRPEEVTQMLAHTLLHVQQQTDEVTARADRSSKQAQQQAKNVLSATGAFRQSKS